MKDNISYKDCQIRGESFQREKNGSWIPQYYLMRREDGSEGTGFPSHQYQFNQSFPTEGEADEFALQKAMEWIDRN